MSGIWNLMEKPNYHFWEIHYCGTRSNCAKKGHDLREVEEVKLKLQSMQNHSLEKGSMELKIYVSAFKSLLSQGLISSKKPARQGY